MHVAYSVIYVTSICTVLVISLPVDLLYDEQFPWECLFSYPDNNLSIRKQFTSPVESSQNENELQPRVEEQCLPQSSEFSSTDGFRTSIPSSMTIAPKFMYDAWY